MEATVSKQNRQTNSLSTYPLACLNPTLSVSWITLFELWYTQCEIKCGCWIQRLLNIIRHESRSVHTESQRHKGRNSYSTEKPAAGDDEFVPKTKQVDRNRWGGECVPAIFTMYQTQVTLFIKHPLFIMFKNQLIMFNKQVQTTPSREESSVSLIWFH